MNIITPDIYFASDLTGLFDLNRQVAFIPGGYGGIGEAIAWGLALHGARVIVAGRNLEKAQSLAQKISDAGFEAEGIALDVESVDAIRDSVDRLVIMDRQAISLVVTYIVNILTHHPDLA